MQVLPAGIKKGKKFDRRGLHFRDFVITLSFANLAYFRVWHELESYNPTRLPAMKWLPNHTALLACMLNVLLAATACTAVTAFFRRRHASMSTPGRIVFLALLAVPCFAVYRVVSERYQILRGELIRVVGPIVTVLIFLAAAAVFAGIILRWHAAVVRWAAVVLIAFAPGVLVTFGWALWGIYGPPPVDLSDRPSPPPSPAAHLQPRVIWLLFDEWDYRLSFVDRPKDLYLPEMDRLKATALSATDAVPPARATALSVPMLLGGERYDRVTLEGPTSIRVTPIGDLDHHLDWNSRKTIFSEARAMNFNTALAGWYLPYCRVLANELNGCEWVPMEDQRNSIRTNSLPQAMTDQVRSLFETSLFSPFGQSLATQFHATQYHRLYESARRFMNDPMYGVVFVHMSIPHAPFIYDRKTGLFTGKNSAARGYLDNLALLDRTIGEFRRALEQSAQWDSSTILFTTDHYFRSSYLLDGKMDFRIPFMLKLAGQKEAAEYTKRFNTLVSKDLLLEILGQKIQTPQQALQWIGRHRNTQEVSGDAPE
jgi:hypothetical protein